MKKRGSPALSIPTASPGVRTACTAILLGAVAFVAYLPAIHGGFVWDDDLLVTANPLVTMANGLRLIWFSAAAPDYTPLTLSSFWLEWRLWGNHPMGYHVVNILLHAGAVVLIWRILRKLEIPGGAFAALLFAVHPVNAASVAWIAERKNTLSLAFFLLSISWFLDFHATRNRRACLLSLAAAACAFLSKGSTVVLPAVLLCCIWWRSKKLTRADFLSLSPFAALAGACAAVTIVFQSRIVSHQTASASLAFRLIRAGDAVWFYLGKDLLPVHLCTYYPEWPIRTGNPFDYLPALLVIACLVLFYLCRGRWSRGLLFGWAYFIIALSPVLGFVNMSFLDQAYVADWWQHIAIIGILALVAAGAARASRVHGSLARGAIYAAAIPAVSFLGFRTWTECEAYRSLETHCRHAIASNPGSWAAQDNLGTALMREGRLGEAEMHYREALRIKPDNFTAHTNLGLVLDKEGRPEEAVGEFIHSLQLNPNDPITHNNLGLLFQEQGNTDGAIAEFRNSLRLKQYNPEAHNNLGFELQAEGKMADAIAEYEEALREAPDLREAHFNLGLALQTEGKLDEAIAEYRAILQLAPGDAEAHNNLGGALQSQGRLEEAISEYREAVRLAPGYDAARDNLENAFKSRLKK